MKISIVLGLATVVSLVHIAFSNPLPRRVQSSQTAPSQPTSVSIQRFEVVDMKERKGSRKLAITLANNSAREVVFFSIMLTDAGNGKSGPGVWGPAPMDSKIQANTTVTIERVIRDNIEIKPFLRSVAFEDGTFEGDESQAKSFLIRREEKSLAIAKYEGRLLALDTSATPAQDVAAVHADLISDLKEFIELDSLPPAKPEEQWERVRLQMKRFALIDILSEVNKLVESFKSPSGPGERLGQRAVVNLKARS